MKKQFTFPLGLKFSLIILLMSLLIGSLIVVSSYQIYSRQIIDHYIRSSKAIEQTVGEFLSEDDISRYYESRETDDTYKEILEKLRICTAASSSRFIYVFVPTEEGLVFIFDSDTDSRGRHHLGEVVSWEANFGGFNQNVMEGKGVESILESREYGWLLTTNTPLYDDAGNFVGYLSVDYSAADLVVDQQNFIKQLTIATILVAAIMTAIFLFIVRGFVIKPINQIAKAANNYLLDVQESVSSTNSITELDIRTNDELESLADSLKTMEQKIQKYLKSLEDANQKAELDSMTGLLNREAFEKRISWSLENDFHGGFNVFFMIDLDYFKKINDVHGHAIGDELILACVAAIRSCFRKTDYISRMGGDEFAVFCKTSTSLDDVEKRAQKLHQAMADIRVQGKITTTISIGIAVFPVNAQQSYQTLYLAADGALYKAKEKGRNTFAISYNP